MTKRSEGQNSQHEGVHAGCISGIINMFQFRQGRAIKSLLSDRKQPSNHAAVACVEHSSDNTVSPIPTEIFEHLRDTEQSKMLMTDANKTSVEELMEGVTFNENGSKQSNDSETAHEQVAKKSENITKKKHQKKERSSAESSDMDFGIDIDEDKLVQAVKLFSQQKMSSDNNRCSEEKPVNLKPDELSSHKNQNLFAKRNKSPRNIVILIPGIEQSRNSETGIPDNNNNTKVQLNENFGWRSPNKNHFYTERFTISPSFKNGLSSPSFKNSVSSPSFKNSVSSPSFKNGEPVGKLKDDSEKSIYSEAKKHLSEMVKSGDKRTVSTYGNNPGKSLGRILSLPEYNGLLFPSPRKPSDAISVKDNPSQRMQNSDSQPCISCSESKDKVQSLDDQKYSLEIECFNEDAIVSEVEEIEQTKELRIPEEANIINGDNTEIEDSELVVDKIERPSPISVLEPLLTDDDLNPASTISQSVEKEIQPHQIHFEEQDICTRISMEDEETTFEYVEAILLGSDLNWYEFVQRWICASEILDQSLFEEVGLFSSKPLHDQKLLFDCANEALKEACEYYFGCFAVKNVSNSIQSVPKGMDLINNIWGRVECCLFQNLQLHSPDQLVKKDWEGSKKWMDIRSDMESIVLDMEEGIFGELVDDIVLSFGVFYL